MDIIYKTVKRSYSEKLQIIHNINNLMFQVIFQFSDCILIKQIIVFSTPPCLGETDFQKIFPGVLREELGHELKMHRCNAFSMNVDTINLKRFPTHGVICKLEKIQQAFLKEIEVKEI